MRPEMADLGRNDNFVKMPMEATDRALAVAVYEGDRSAALALIERYATPLFNLIYRSTGMTQVADDVTREVLAGAITRLQQRVPPAEERWMARLAGDAWRQLMALELKSDRPAERVRISPKHWDIEALRLADESPSGPRRVAQKLRQRLWRAWSALTLRERFVLALCDTAKLTVAELAQALGESPGTARVRRDEAKLALMAHLTSRQSSWPAWLGDARRGGTP